jgi:hypothetical protein
MGARGRRINIYASFVITNAFRLSLVLVALFTTGLLSGCVGVASTTLPPRLSADERAKVRNAHLPFTVGVERYHYPVYSDSLVSALQKLKLFDKVDYRDRLRSAPSLVAEVERTVGGATAIPFGPLLSFGIIPMTVPETAGYVFSLHSPSNENEKRIVEGFSFRSLKDERQKVVIDYRYRSKVTLGWIALFRAFSPDEVLFSPKSHPRFRDALKSAILTHSNELARLSATNRL